MTFRLLALLACILLLSAPAQAADITMGDDCDIRLSGQIVKGDADRFGALMDGAACTYSTLHLSSPGGSVTEALAIPQHFSRTTTVIDAEQTCLSACALIFMAGHTCAGAPYTCQPTRRMHPTATLGFHAPFLQPDQKQQLVPLDLSFSAALDIFAQIQSTFSKLSSVVASTGYKQAMIHPDLFAQMFSTPPQEFYTITTNDQFYSFDIGLMDDIPNTATPAFDRQRAATLCYNMLYSTYRGWNHSEFGFADYDTGGQEYFESVTNHVQRQDPAPWLGDGLSIPVDFVEFRNLNLGMGWSGWCEIMPEPGSGTVSVNLYRQDNMPSDNDRADVRAYMHYSMAWPPRTPLSAVSWKAASGAAAATPASVPGPDPVALARAYFDRLGKRDGGAPSALWIPEKREAIDRAAAGICDASLVDASDADLSGGAATVSLRARVTGCGATSGEVYALRMTFTPGADGWRISALNSAE
jgi:hypothetical protein